MFSSVLRTNSQSVILFFFFLTFLAEIYLYIVGKESPCNAGNPRLIPRSGRSPGKGNGNPFQYSSLENPKDRGAWWAIVHGVARVGHDLVTKPRHQVFYALFEFYVSLSDVLLHKPIHDT